MTVYINYIMNCNIIKIMENNFKTKSLQVNNNKGGNINKVFLYIAIHSVFKYLSRS